MKPETAPLPASPKTLAELLATRPQANEAPTLVGVEGGYLAYFLAALARVTKAPLVVLLPDNARMGLLEDGLGFFSGTPSDIASFPAWEHPPFSQVSPSRAQQLHRVATVARLHIKVPKITLVSAEALLDRIAPPEHYRTHSLRVRAGDQIDRAALVRLLIATGYHRVATVEDQGSFAVRGELIDVWPPMSEAPVRVELFDEEVERLRHFDPSDQQGTGEPLKELWITPARELALTSDTLSSAKVRLHALADARHVPSSRMRALLSDLENHILPVGLDELLPAFHEALTPLTAHLPEQALWLSVDMPALSERITQRGEELAKRHGKADAKEGELLSSLAQLSLSTDEALSHLESRVNARFQGFFFADHQAAPRLIARTSTQHALRKALETAARDPENTEPLTPLFERLSTWREEGAAVVVTAHSEGGFERIQSLLSPYGLVPKRVDGLAPAKLASLRRETDTPLFALIGSPGEGFVALDEGLVLLDEAELFGKAPKPKRRQRRASTDQILKSYRDLKEGDFVVHLSHGIGRYQGLREITFQDDYRAEMLEIAYADNSTLLVPVEKLHLVSRYQGGDKQPKLDKLGGSGGAAWNKTKSKVKKAVRDIADQLLKLYAARESSQGYSFGPPDAFYHRFESAFPYEETPDQLAAIEDTLSDMQRSRPMDRLICGDVGFGKTEVAIRAAMKAVCDGKQVGVLVPTQVLAEQHRLSFQRRLEGLPVVVESLSAMKSTTRQKEITAATALGGVDILIGTHRLLSKDVRFKDLGLLVIDEEHRFGVAQKEHVKRYKANVDVLTLTATPIPRTLHLSLLGLRDISLIQSPPQDRHPVQTFVAQPSEEVIRDAIAKELARGGQVFFIHHRVSDIDKQAELIGNLVPGARVAVGHGQMGEGQLEKVMMRFVSGEANVLVATTIVESGVDIPNANTILINHADHFGLAQLYQLRGRVGRSSTRAFCYLLVPSTHALNQEAAERIATIQRFSELGSGYSVASHDLDIRGAGDLLGADQAGNIDAVGYDAYMELLQQAIGELRTQGEDTESDPEQECEIKIAVDARIPETWLAETPLRLRLYRAFAGARTQEELSEVLGAAVDRYGPPPPSVRNLAAVMALKLEAKELALTLISLGKDKLVLGLSGRGKLEPHILAAYIQELAARGLQARLLPEGKLVMPLTSKAPWGPELVREELRVLSAFATHYKPKPLAAPAPPKPSPQWLPGARPVRTSTPARRVYEPTPRRR